MPRSLSPIFFWIVKSPSWRPSGELLLAEQRDDVADARIDLLARVEDHVDERVEAVAVEATLGERAGEAALRARAADVVGGEAEQALAHRRHLLEREKALELTAQNVDRRVHLLLFPRVSRREGKGLTSRVALTGEKAAELSGKIPGATRKSAPSANGVRHASGGVAAGAMSA